MGSPTKNWSKLLTHRSFAVGTLCDAGSLMQNQRLAAKNPMSEPTAALKAGRVRLGRSKTTPITYANSEVT
jgi:hypothetical protein